MRSSRYVTCCSTCRHLAFIVAESDFSCDSHVHLLHVLQAQIQAEELARYEAEKTGQRLWTAALSAVGVAATYSLYGREVCASYLLGALGGIFYLRLLGKTVDKYGGQANILEGASSALGNQRLLIPVILALGYNR
jgi:ATP synthase protein I